MFIIWDNELANSSSRWGAQSPCRGKVIKMLYAQLKTHFDLRGSCRTELGVPNTWLIQVDSRVVS